MPCLDRVLPTLCALSIAWTPALPATMEGQTFDDSVRMANRDLQLNGLGVRAILFIKGYVAGLYLEARASQIHDIVAMPGPMRLQIRMLRRASPDDFIGALVDGIRKNASEAEMVGLKPRVAQLERTIQSIGGTKEGDVIDLDFVPERGTTLAINGMIAGPPIVGADFFHAVLGIFVGDRPVDSRLKNGLLGR